MKILFFLESELEQVKRTTLLLRNISDVPHLRQSHRRGTRWHPGGTQAALMRHWGGTRAALRRHWGGTRAALRRHSGGTVAALRRHSGGTETKITFVDSSFHSFHSGWWHITSAASSFIPFHFGWWHTNSFVNHTALWRFGLEFDWESGIWSHWNLEQLTSLMQLSSESFRNILMRM